MDNSWPPKSPHAAFLSSPSGRRKFQQGESIGLRSPMKRSLTSPSLVDRLRAARTNNDILHTEPGIPEEEEDEETLELQLAAIEAKLKLKKLQQHKSRSEVPTPRPGSSRPSSAGRDGARTYFRTESVASQESNGINVQVTLSPTKRAPVAVEARSPSRVLLGIDKGIRGTDVSLQRARASAGDNGRPKGVSASHNRPSSRSSVMSGTRSSSQMSNRYEPKSFSERMISARTEQDSRDQRRERTNRARTTGFKLDRTEMENYRFAAEENRKREIPRSPTKSRLLPAYTRDEVLRATENATSKDRILKKSQSMPGLRLSPSKESNNVNGQQADSSLFEGFSGLHLSSRILPHSFLKRTLPSDQYTVYKIKDLLRDVTSPAFELPDEVGDFVVFGVIASKSAPLDQKQSTGEEKTKGTNDWEKKWEDGTHNSKKFMAIKLTDLKWSLDLYLFGSAVPRYYRLSPGTVVAILNPGIMPPKRGREDTGAFSLNISNGEDTVLEIGTAQHLGFCNAMRKDGRECGDWVDSSKTEICEFHLNLQIAKSQASRMGVNAGTNGFGAGLGKGPNNRNNIFDRRRVGIREGEGRRTIPQQGGSRYDRFTGSHYYVSKSNPGNDAGPPRYHSGMSTAKILDMDDPFIAEGQLSRDREALVQRRLADQEKEREIAKKLGKIENGGAGREYLQHKTGDASSQASNGNSSFQRSAHQTKVNILQSRAETNGNGKRAAENVRLSPVKKTRFVTEKGIREAGRESLGVTSNDLDEEDDDLDIV